MDILCQFLFISCLLEPHPASDPTLGRSDVHVERQTLNAVPPSTKIDVAQIRLSIEPPARDCSKYDLKVEAVIHVKNEARIPLKIYISTISSPYELYSLSYKLADERGKEIPGVSGFYDGDVPYMFVVIPPGKSTQLLAPIYKINPAMFDHNFRLSIKDIDGTVFQTPLFRTCVT